MRESMQKSAGPVQRRANAPATMTHHENALAQSPRVVMQREAMPRALTRGIAALSGMDLSDVKVHRDSAKPAQLQALAFAQNNEIHLGPGQEKHLPHEAWHIVQQRQGRVKTTLQEKGVGINDEPGLEKEATVMGERAMRVEFSSAPMRHVGPHSVHAQHKNAVIQRNKDEKAEKKQQQREGKIAKLHGWKKAAKLMKYQKESLLGGCKNLRTTLKAHVKEAVTDPNASEVWGLAARLCKSIEKFLKAAWTDFTTAFGDWTDVRSKLEQMRKDTQGAAISFKIIHERARQSNLVQDESIVNLGRLVDAMGEYVLGGYDTRLCYETEQYEEKRIRFAIDKHEWEKEGDEYRRAGKWADHKGHYEREPFAPSASAIRLLASDRANWLADLKKIWT